MRGCWHTERNANVFAQFRVLEDSFSWGIQPASETWISEKHLESLRIFDVLPSLRFLAKLGTIEMLKS